MAAGNETRVVEYEYVHAHIPNAKKLKTNEYPSFSQSIDIRLLAAL